MMVKGKDHAFPNPFGSGGIRLKPSFFRNLLGSRVHGVAMIKVTKGKISHWREYWYESDLDWETFMGENKF